MTAGEATTGMPDVPTALPTSGNLVTRGIGRLALRALGGWTFRGRLPDLARFVIIVAPHTSSWDFVIGVAAKLALGLRIGYLGKHTLFRPPLGWLMRALGGIPVHRRTSTETVQQVVDRFAVEPRMVLALSPEGTRRKVERWRTGFWHIAHGADVPIVPVGLDFPTHTIRIGDPVAPGDDLDAAVAGLKAWYRGIVGRFPELT
jgi:1-acyl-sn-glycerol-3-phosphate acyltransferase